MHSTIIILTCIVIFGCNPNTSRNDTLTSEEYEVFSAVISSHFGYRLGIPFEQIHHDTILIFNSTIPGKVFGERSYSTFYPKLSESDTGVSLKWFSTSGEWDSLLSNYKMVLEDTVKIQKSKLILPLEYSLFSKGDKTNENISISFSRVGFNLKRNEALVYFEYHEYESSESFTILLRKVNNQWNIVDGYGLRSGMLSGYDYYLIRKPKKETAVP